MPAGKQILDRIKSVKNTGKITRAMELISTVKMKKAADIALGARPFAMEASGIFSRVAEEISMSPYVEGKEKKSKKKLKTLIVVITSNKGLCGAYNINVFREVIKQTKGTKTDCITIGKKAREFMLRTGHSLVADYSETFKDDPTPAQVKSISASIRELYLSGEYSGVKVIYSFYISAIAQKAVTRPFLPVSKESLSAFLEEITGSIISPVTYSGEYKIEPSKQAVADRIVPLILDLMFHEMILEAKASEHAARMVAMKNARESSQTKVKELTLIYNKARQAAITKEISEIVSGVESMKDV
ncbi:ATP synthase F1 subunit gamma [Candidatus Gracilibacteria bacterium]|nr:ATP synthase F1 subunit gamma [Candidatus Gracilibacteria bacterium]